MKAKNQERHTVLKWFSIPPNYNANGSFGGSSRTTTTHYGANGAPAGTMTRYNFGR